MSTPAIRKLQYTQYESATGPYYTHSVTNPTWAAIESAVQRLDRCLFPFVCLYQNPIAKEDDIPQLEVCGGNGAYVVAVRPNGQELWLRNPSGGPEEVDVWVSDQGASFPASEVCDSLSEVLRVVRHFYLYGEPAPQAIWTPPN